MDRQSAAAKASTPAGVPSPVRSTGSPTLDGRGSLGRVESRADPRTRWNTPAPEAQMTRRPLFWIIFAVVAVFGAVTGVRYFTVALPIVALDITMDRATAGAEAGSLAERFGWGPEGARSAISFGQVDSLAQPYVELERGGREAFFGLAERGEYHSYVWTVRRFAEADPQESRVWFTPAGLPYGFRLTLAEDDPGTGNLSSDSARAVAEAAASRWNVALDRFALLESSVETLPSGRVDHDFVYARRDGSLGEAELRLQLGVAGSQPSEVRHFVQVPESFARRYGEMRSANDTIALAANAVFILVFILLGAGVGTALLLRQRWLLWRVPLAWGALVGTLFGLNILNALPLAWMQYDTAVPRSVYLGQQLLAAGGVAVLLTPLLAFCFMAAESLGRRAFPDHPQQWRFWSRDVAASTPALGRTTAAYLLLGLELGYIVLFYLGTSRLTGWWTPASPQVQPDLLATYQPWLGAVSVSLFAALWEESVFRAIPIAAAALIGARFGKRSAWIWGAVALQAVVFAAGHANYPQQPPYARVAELTLPAFGWGVIYLYFGLVPTILTHFLYDLALFSSLLFTAEGPGILMDRGVIILAGLLPLAIVLRARMGGRGRAQAPDWAYNRAWSPPEPVEATPPSAEAPHAVPPPPSGRVLPIPARVLYVAGGVGTLLWMFSTATADRPFRLTATRGDVLAAAEAQLGSRDADVDGWSALARTRTGRRPTGNGESPSNPHRYVFEEAGPDEYRALMGHYLPPPHWLVRFVDFGAAPEERVEEHRVYFGGNGELVRIAHLLPEGREGASPNRDQARILALDEVERRFGLTEDGLIEVGAEETERPARRDWTFTFVNPAVLDQVDGEARIAVEMRGTEVGDAYRYVHVPEAWVRAEREASSRRTLIGGVGAVILLLGYGVGAVTAVVVWGRSGLAVGVVPPVGVTVLAAVALSRLNAWPTTVAGFSTSQPFGIQSGTALFGYTLLAVVAAGAIALAVALAHSWLDASARRPPPPFVGVAVGLALVGLSSLVASVAGGLPRSPDYSPASAMLPVASAPLEAVTPFLFGASALLLLVAVHQRFGGNPMARTLLAFAFLLIGALQVPRAFQESLGLWTFGGLVGGFVVWGVVRLAAAYPALVPGIVGTTAVMGLLELMMDAPYSGARIGALLGVGVVAMLARIWTKDLGHA